MEMESWRWHNPVSRAEVAAIHTYLRAAAAALKFHPKHVTTKYKTKYIMKIPHINNIYDKTSRSQQNSD
jgi:hypothetical protein